jgi:hypothetical protein
VEGAFEADDALAGEKPDAELLAVERLDTKSSAPASMPLTMSDLSSGW